jgi:hypothetical protein
VIFFDFLQSDWLQQRAAFYDILTVVEKSYFQCFHLQGFFPAARKYWSLQGIYKEIKFTRKWQGKIQKLKEIARISVTYTSYKS